MAVSVNIVVFARSGYWTIISILAMVVKNYYSPKGDEEQIEYPSEDLSEDDWANEKIAKAYSDKVGIVRFKEIIKKHTEQDTLPSKTNDRGERTYAPRDFKAWWFEYDMKSFVDQLDFEKSNALYEVFEEMDNIYEAETAPATTPEPVQAKPEPSVSTKTGEVNQPIEVNIDADAFVRRLKFYYSEPDVFISEAGKRPIRFTLESIGFHKPDGVLADDFVLILKERNGPSYDLGKSHSYLGSGGQNFQDVSSDGQYEYPDDDARKSGDSTGLNEVPQKTENPDYRKRKTRLKDINKKIREFIEKEFSIMMGEKFKLYEKQVDKGSGTYQFKFQTRRMSSANITAYARMTEKQILEKLEKLSNAVTSNTDTENENTINDYMSLYQHAISKGISESKIENSITPRKDLKN